MEESVQGIPMATTPSHRGDKGSVPWRQQPVTACPLSLNDFFIVAKVVIDAVDSIFALERIFGRFENEVVRYGASFH